jgi:hypothetical protein
VQKDNVKNANLDEYIKIEERNFWYRETTEGSYTWFSIRLMMSV